MGFLRSGAIEFQAFEVAERNQYRIFEFNAWLTEQQILRALDDCAGLTADGLLPLPVLVGLSFSGIHHARLRAFPRAKVISEEYGEHSLTVTPILINAWDADANTRVRRMFDELYQNFGSSRCPNYDQNGERMWLGENHDPAPAPPRQHWRW